MKPKFFIVALTLLMTLSGCYKTKVETQAKLIMNEDEQEHLFNECKVINKSGDILNLLSEIKHETDDVFKLLEGDDILSSQNKVKELASSIDKKSKAVIFLSNTDWVSSIWNYEKVWEINNDDFNDTIGAHVKNGFTITNSIIQKVYFMGEERSDLLDKIIMKREGNNIQISYKNIGSSLELCQLQKTLMILVEVSYRNITNRNHRFFNLTLNYKTKE